MLYYRARQDAYDYFNKVAIVKNELFTARERETKVRYLKDSMFQPVNISKNRTYFSFGCRFEMSE